MNIHSNSKRTQNWKHKKAVQRMLRIEKGEEREMGTAYQGRECGGGEAGGIGGARDGRHGRQDGYGDLGSGTM